MKTKKTTADVTNSICQQVTAKLLEMIENGVNPWRCPWMKTGAQEPDASNAAVSHTTGTAYSLVNQILLGFRPGEYLTFNQVKKEGGNVKKGAISQIIVFWQSGGFKPVTPSEVTDTDTDTEDTTDEDGGQWVKWKAPILKYYRVFHIDDCEGIKPKHAVTAKPVQLPTVTPIDAAEAAAKSYCERSGVKLNIQQSNSAFYRPAADSVTVPLREQFTNIAEFYSTLFHELTHSTGHESRLNRFKCGVYAAKKEYSREELVAEIGAATALNHLGIDDKDTEVNSAAYLKGWGSYLKDDPKAFIVAAGRAEKAFNMIFNR